MGACFGLWPDCCEKMAERIPNATNVIYRYAAVVARTVCVFFYT